MLDKNFIRRVHLKRNLIDYTLLIAAVFSAGLGLEGFLIPNHFIDGGVTGISLLLHQVTNYPVSMLLFLVNVPFLILGYKYIGRNISKKGLLGIIGLVLVLEIFEFPIITDDKLLVSIFGGFFLGMGIGLAIRAGGVIDGTEIFAIYTSKKSGLTVGDIILLVNIVIFSIATFVLPLEAVLYSILIYIVASKTVDFVSEGIEEYIGLTIISEKNNEIRKALTENLRKGVTLYKGKSGYKEEQKEFDVIFTVVTRFDLGKVKSEIEKIDPHAFIVVQSIRDLKGGVIRRKLYKSKE